MALYKKAANTKNTTLSTQNEVGQLFRFSSAPTNNSTRHTVFEEKIQNLVTAKQDKLSSSNLLPGTLISFDDESTIYDKIQQLQTAVDSNTAAIENIESADLPSISISGTEEAGYITTINGITQVSQLQFTGDDLSLIGQTTAFTAQHDASLQLFTSLFDALQTDATAIESEQSAQSSQLTDLQTSYDALYTSASQYDASLTVVTGQLTTATGTLIDLSARATELTGWVSDLSARYEINTADLLDLNQLASVLSISATVHQEQLLNLSGSITVGNETLSDLSSAVQPLYNWDDILLATDASISILTSRTRDISAISVGGVTTTQVLANMSIAPLSVSAPTTIPQLSIQVNPYYMDWTVGSTAAGIVKALDAVMRTNCSGVALVDISSGTGLRIGLAAGETTTLVGTDLSIAQTLYATNVSCGQLRANYLFSGGIHKSIQTVEMPGNAVTLSYLSGDTFFITGTMSADFTVNITGLPAEDNRTFTFRLIYTPNYKVAVVTATDSNGSITMTAPSPIFLNGAAPTTGTKLCEITIIRSFTFSRALVQMKNYNL